MVDRSYMLARPAPPSALKRFVNQAAIPAAIDAVAAMESGLERLGQSTRQRPWAALSLAAGGGCMIAALLRQRHRR